MYRLPNHCLRFSFPNHLFIEFCVHLFPAIPKSSNFHRTLLLARRFILHSVPSDSLYRQIKSAQSISMSLRTFDAKCSFAIHAVTESTSSSTPYNTSPKRSHLVNFDNKFCKCSLRKIDTISECYNLLKNRLRVLEARLCKIS